MPQPPDPDHAAPTEFPAPPARRRRLVAALRPRPSVAVLAAVLAVGVLAGGVDPVAAVMVGCGVVVTRAAVRRRGRRTVRVLLAALGAVAVLGAGAVAVSTVHWHVPRTPFLVRRPEAPTVLPTGLRSRTATEVLGFVDAEEPDSVAGEGRDAGQASELAATGVTLGRTPGTLAGTPVADTLVRAHLAGARGYLVLTNVNADTGDFDGRRADAVLASPAARARVVAALGTLVTRDGWDGVVVDLESVGAAGRSGLVTFTAQLRAALGGRAVLVAVPAWEAQDPGEAAGVDLPGLAAAADRIVWMAYDEHDPGSDAGPIGGMAWVRSTVDLALRSVPAYKLLLGVAGYGYSWAPTGRGTELTWSGLAALAARPGARSRWDAAAGEQHVVLPDGTQAWFQTARSLQVRARLAEHLRLAGVALWRVGSEEPGALARVPGPIVRHEALARGLTVDGRPVEPLGGAGAVALTFDDGPDPDWTPQILDVLEREHVPATFFVVGRQAESSPDLLRREIADGDVVGNHTYSHPDMNQLPTWRAQLEIEAGEAVVEGITGRKPLLYRSPYGDGDVRIKGRTRDQLAEAAGLHGVSWTDDPMDWARPGVDRIVARAVSQASDSGVILLHDSGGDRSQTLAALPRIIEQLRALGYTFTTADAVDAGVVVPYANPSTGAAKLRDLAVVTGFRLVLGLALCLRWLVVLIAVASIARVLLTLPFALVHRWRERRPGPAAPDGGTPGGRLPVTVLVPAHNEAAVIGTALRTLAELPEGSAPAEVIVIDDGSTDGTADIAERHGVTVVRQQQAGKAAALNAGIARAAHEIVVVLDADTIVTPGMLGALAAHFADPRVGAVAGNVKVGNRRGVLARLQAAEYVTSLNLERRAQAQLNAVTVVPGAAGAFRRTALLQVGGYPTATLVEDADLTVRLLRAGWRIPYESRAVAWTEAPQTVAHALRQRRRWAFGTIQVLTVHAEALGRRRAGAVGSLGLPWVLLTQVLLPAAAPIADLYMLYLLLTGDAGPVATTLLVGALLDAVAVGAAVLMDGEDRSMILTGPALRWAWRPLLVLAVVGSVRRWLRGEAGRWTPSFRYASVRVPGLPVPRRAPKAAGGTPEPELTH